jgi:hypothetical protein
MEEPVTVQCPWCGESFVSFFDISVANQDYIEDCQVCCRPIDMMVKVDRRGQVRVVVKRS